MSEMVERVARALYSEDDPEAWDEAVRVAAKYPDEKHLQEDVDETRAKAQRAIEAMQPKVSPELDWLASLLFGPAGPIPPYPRG